MELLIHGEHLFEVFFLFNTTLAGTITAAVLSVRGYDKWDTNSFIPNVNIYSSSPASNTAIAAGDFDSFGSTAFATAITYAGFSTGYNDFTFNSTGIAAINKSGISKFGARNASYDVAASAPTWASGGEAAMRIFYSEYGSGYKPKLVITYTPPPLIPIKFSSHFIGHGIGNKF